MIEKRGGKNLSLTLIFHFLLLTLSSSLSSSKNDSKIPDRPTYFVLSSQTFEPGSNYKIVISLFDGGGGGGGGDNRISLSSYPYTIQAKILRDGSAIVSEMIEVYVDSTETLTLRIPEHIVVYDSDYRLVVEGSHFGHASDGSLFREERILGLKTPKIWILLETERPIYRPTQIVKIRLIPFGSDHRPWKGAVDISLKNPQGEEMARWPREFLVSSAIHLEYPLADLTMIGEWKLSARAHDQQKKLTTRTFRVTKFDPNVDTEIRIWLPPTIIPGDAFVRGWISTTKIVGGASTKGTLRLFAVLKNNATDPFPVKLRLKFYEGKVIFLSTNRGYSELKSFSGYGEWQISQKEIQLLRSRKPNSKMGTMEMTIEAEFYPSPELINGRPNTNPQSGSIIKGFSTSKLLPRNLEMKIIAPTALTYRPDLPYLSWVKVFKADGSDLTFKELESGMMLVESSMKFANGSIVKLLPLRLHRQHKFFSNNQGPLWKLSYSLRHVLPPHLEKMNQVQLFTPLVETILKIKYRTRNKMSVQKIIRLIPENNYIGEGLRVSTSPIVPRIGDNIIFHVHSNFFLDGFHCAILTDNRIVSTRFVMMGQSSLKTFHETATPTMAPESTLFVWYVTKDGKIISAATRFSVSVSTKSQVSVTAQPVLNNGFGGYTHVTVKGEPGTIVALNALDIYLEARTAKLNYPSPIQVHGAQLPSGFVHHGLLALSDATSNYTNDTIFEENHYNYDNDNDDMDRTLSSPSIPPASPVESELNPTGFWQTEEIGINRSLSFKIPFQTSGKIILSAVAFSGQGFYHHPELTIKVGNPFQVTLELPERCRYGEIISARLTFINQHNHGVSKTIRIDKSHDFTFVDLEGNTISDDYQSFIVQIPGNKFRTLLIPFRPSYSGVTHFRVKIDDSQELLSESILVQEEGILKDRHQILSVDLINHRYFIDKFNPSVIYHKSVTISVSGGIHGPLLPTLPINASSLIKNLPVISCDDAVFSILLTIFHDDQRRNQNAILIKEEENLTRKSQRINLQRLLSYRSQLKGGFSFTRQSGPPSIWITSLALRALHKLSQHNLNIIVDPDIIYDTLEWLTSQQNNDGSFSEFYLYKSSKSRYIPYEFREISLTAQVLLVLAEIKHDSSSPKTVFTIDRAIRCLTSKLGDLDKYGSTLDVALVARALQVARAPGAEAAFEVLAKRRNEKLNLFYWGEDHEGCDESLSLRSTSIALLVYAERGEFMTEPIVRWINSKRKYASGWISLADTALAIEALNLWSARFPHDDTNSNMAIELFSRNTEQDKVVVIVDNYISQEIKLEEGRNGINVEGRGQGVSLVQLHSSYRVTNVNNDVNISKTSFDLEARAEVNPKQDYKIGFLSCQRWHCRNKGGDKSISGPAVLKIQLPTGYKVDPRDILSSLDQNLTKEIVFQDGFIYIFFPKLSSSYECVNFSMTRKFPVSNLSPFIDVKIFDYYSSDRKNETLLLLPRLRNLEICQVCGSSTCPNCKGKEPTTFSVNSSSDVIFNNIMILPSLLLVYLFNIS